MDEETTKADRQEQIKKWSTVAMWGGIGLLIALGLGTFATCRSDERDCQDRGEAYYRDIGSWPTLSDGRSASGVVQERCARSVDAF